MNGSIVKSVRVTHALDYGQFTITGTFDRDTDELALLARAQAEPPSAGNGHTVLVLSPHQNDFSMEIDLEVWSSRPQSDADDWDQVTVEPLAVDSHATVRFGSPTLDDTTCSVPAGSYLVEISGRGFVNYGWPGSTEPDDEWRLRLWPAGDGSEPPPPKLWRMPGYGTPWSQPAT